jgi:hypothetical protein
MEKEEQSQVRPKTILEQLQEKKQSLIRKHNAQMRELNRVISLLTETEAEKVIIEATELLYKEN